MLNSFWLLSPGHKHRHKRHKLKRRPVAGVTTVSSAAPVVSAGIFNDVESLSTGLASDAFLRSESGSASTRPSNDSSGDSGPHRRSKRFLSYPRFVEVMLVADSKMVEHHGSNLQHYILTLMSIVSSLMSDGFMAASRDVWWLARWMCMYLYTMHINEKRVATCLHICALNVCTCAALLFVLQVKSASLWRRAVGGKRAA